MTRPDAARVVVTGLGVMSGLGRDVTSFWDGLRAGRSCLTRWQGLDPRVASKVGGPFGPYGVDEAVRDLRRLVPERARDAVALAQAGAWTRLTAVAAAQAVRDADIDGAIDPARFGHVCAAQNLSLGYYADHVPGFREDTNAIPPELPAVAEDTDVLRVVNGLFDLRGPSAVIGGACASGNLAVLAAVDLIRRGRADAVLVTGAPFPTHPMILHALAMIEAITFRGFNDAPARASRPFDALREGFAPSESAGAVVVESVASARARGAAIRAEVYGGASASDASRLPKPHVDGQVRAIRGALADADLAVDDVDYVNAHATSTPLGDRVEVRAIEASLGERAWKVPVNATKSMIGHGITSASVLELVATTLQIEHQVVHPTINQERPDPELCLDFVPNHARPHAIRAALSNAFGFGGINSCIAVGQLR